MLFALTGVSEVMAAPKPVKAKITRQPVASAVELGSSVTLRVVFSSPTPATCQWRRNRVPLPEATDSMYVIDTVLPEDAGSYDVLITNAAGVTASKPVVLTVNLAPASLPVDAVIHGDFTIKVPGESVSSDGAYVVTGTKTLQDPEAPDDSYTFTYKRLPKNKASLVISGSFYDEDLDANVSVKETLSLTFTGVSDDGELQANVTGKGVFTLSGGKKINFTSTGTIALQLTDSAGTGMTYGGSLIVNNGGSGGVVVTAATINLVNIDLGSLSGSGSGTLLSGAQGVISLSPGSLVSFGTINFLSNGTYSFSGGLTGGQLPVNGLYFNGDVSNLTIGPLPTFTGDTLIFDPANIAQTFSFTLNSTTGVLTLTPVPSL